MFLALLAFAIPAILMVLLPGPDSLVVVRGLTHGRRQGAMTALGVLCGVFIWVAAACLGLAALLHASEIGYWVLKLIGACYLIWIGMRTLRAARRPTGEHAADVPPQLARRAGKSGFLAGFLTDILNPKVGVTFVTLLPGFVPHGQSVGWTTFALGLEYVVFTALYFTFLIALSAAVAAWMGRPRIRRRIDAVTGLVLVGFGVRLAAEA